MNTTHHAHARGRQGCDADSGTDSDAISRVGQHRAAVRHAARGTASKSLDAIAVRERSWCPFPA